jgi:hypothetical protein
MQVSRREALAAALSAGGAARVEAASGGVPQVTFGKHRISRLIVGGNPVSANSHVSPAMDREMMDYFTVANAKKMLRDCEEAGINTWQSRGDRHIMRILHEYRAEGGKIQWVGQTASEVADVPRNIRTMAPYALGIYHHGSQTDRWWAAGKIDHVREMLKVTRDTGVQVGLGTHIPEVVDYVESKNWDLDFYMACVYNLSRTEEENSKLAGRPIKGEYFHHPDRAAMLERVRRTSKQCLIFKVYGATRNCDSEETMRGVMRQAFQFAKPNDAVVVGMFPKRTEQVRQNCRLVREVLA